MEVFLWRLVLILALITVIEAFCERKWLFLAKMSVCFFIFLVSFAKSMSSLGQITLLIGISLLVLAVLCKNKKTGLSFACQEGLFLAVLVLFGWEGFSIKVYETIPMIALAAAMANTRFNHSSLVLSYVYSTCSIISGIAYFAFCDNFFLALGLISLASSMEFFISRSTG